MIDESRRGLLANCPDCQTPLETPTTLNVHQCPRCGQRLMIAPQLKGALVHCSSCQEAIRVPGLASNPVTGESAVVSVCPRCHASVNVAEEIANRPTPCPKCGEQVVFGDPLGRDTRSNVGPPKPKGHDEFRFRRKSK